MKIVSAINHHTVRMLAGVILIFLLIPAYSNSFDPYMTLTEHNSGSAVLVKRGQVFKVLLTTNPTTGYQWETISINKEMLKQVETRLIRRGNAYGSGGMIVFKFEALMEGDTNLKIGYFRPFDKDKKIERIFNLTVKIYP